SQHPMVASGSADITSPRRKADSASRFMRAGDCKPRTARATRTSVAARAAIRIRMSRLQRAVELRVRRRRARPAEVLRHPAPHEGQKVALVAIRGEGAPPRRGERAGVVLLELEAGPRARARIEVDDGVG